jgi:hypothetical protein
MLLVFLRHCNRLLPVATHTQKQKQNCVCAGTTHTLASKHTTTQ